MSHEQTARRPQRLSVPRLLPPSRVLARPCPPLVLDLLQEGLPVDKIPHLGEFPVLQVVEGVLRRGDLAPSRLYSLEGALVGTGNLEVEGKDMAVGSNVPHVPAPVGKCRD